jgi:hypothetical protein
MSEPIFKASDSDSFNFLEVFLVAELIVLELLDISAQRAKDEKTGFTLLKVG